MLGYWVKNCPVKINNEKVKATVYLRKGQTIISITSWAAQDTYVRLSFDQKALDLNPQSSELMAPL